MLRRHLLEILAAAALSGCADFRAQQEAKELWNLINQPVDRDGDSNFSKEFDQLRAKHPFLATVQKSVARAYTITDSWGDIGTTKSIGSAVLIDKYGTVVFDAHQTALIQKGIVFDFINSKTGKFFTLKSEGLEAIMLPGESNAPDVAFATITDPNFKTCLEMGWVQPVRWGRSNFGAGINKEIVLAGFPSNECLLHAVEGAIANSADAENLEAFNFSCTVGVLAHARNGMSGSGAFYNGLFVGTTECLQKTDRGILTRFNPSERLYTLYQYSFPERVDPQLARLMDNIEPPMTCRITRPPFRARDTVTSYAR